VGEIGLMAGASVLGLPLPLSAVQILYVNLATDGLPALALAVDPPEDDLMQQPPRDKRIGIFTPPVTRLMLLGGIWSALANISLFIAALWHYSQSLDEAAALKRAMTVTFVSLVLIQFFKAYSFRSDHLHVLHKPLANKWLNLAIVWELGLLFAVVYVPWLQSAFETASLSWWEWLVLLLWSHTILPVLELGKSLERWSWFRKRE
jgi:Ca2+-transporting ATPase